VVRMINPMHCGLPQDSVRNACSLHMARCEAIVV